MAARAAAQGIALQVVALASAAGEPGRAGRIDPALAHAAAASIGRLTVARCVTRAAVVTVAAHICAVAGAARLGRAAGTPALAAMVGGVPQVGAIATAAGIAIVAGAAAATAALAIGAGIGADWAAGPAADAAVGKVTRGRGADASAAGFHRATGPRATTGTSALNAERLGGALHTTASAMVGVVHQAGAAAVAEGQIAWAVTYSAGAHLISRAGRAHGAPLATLLGREAIPTLPARTASRAARAVTGARPVLARFTSSARLTARATVGRIGGGVHADLAALDRTALALLFLFLLFGSGLVASGLIPLPALSLLAVSLPIVLPPAPVLALLAGVGLRLTQQRHCQAAQQRDQGTAARGEPGQATCQPIETRRIHRVAPPSPSSRPPMCPAPRTPHRLTAGTHQPRMPRPRCVIGLCDVAPC